MALDDLEEPGWSKTRWGMVIAAIVLVLGGVAFAVRHRAKPTEAKFETAKLTRGAIVARVTATGILSALVTVQVGAQVSGRVSELHADFNTAVKKGDLIAKIDPQLFEASLEQAKANYQSAQASYLRAKIQAADGVRQADRSKLLREKNLIAQADLDTAQANADALKAAADAANAAISQNRAALHQAQVNLDYTSIVAPISGTVISRAVELGQTVASALQTPTLFTIAEDLRRMQVDTSVAEADVGKLEAGQDATFIVDAFPNDRFKGTIRQIRNAATTVSNVVTYDAVIDVENPDLKLRPGMTANVTVIYAQKQDALRIPNAALRFRPTAEMLGTPAKAAVETGTTLASSGNTGAARSGGKGGTAPSPGGGPRNREAAPKMVYVMREGKPAGEKVKLGVTDGTFTELVEGSVQEGELIVTGATAEATPAAAATRPLGMSGGGGGRGGGPRL